MIVKCEVDAALPWEGLNQSELGSSSIVTDTDTDSEDDSDAKSDVNMVTAASRDELEDSDNTITYTCETDETESTRFGKTIIADSRYSVLSQPYSDTASMGSTCNMASSMSEAGNPIRVKTSSCIKIHLETILHSPHENLVSIKTRRYHKVSPWTT